MEIPSLYDTIAAIATPPGEGGIGIIRVSGEKAEEVGKRFFRKVNGSQFESFEPRYVYFGKVVDGRGEELDRGIGIFFRAPHSYTGEDVFEFHVHGSPLLLEKLLGEILSTGTRLAEPGEFTKRAFLNGKLDLIQAEAVIDIIQSSSERALKNSERLLDGDLSRKLITIRNSLKEILLHLESAIDFPEEDLEIEEYPTLQKLANKIKKELQRLLDSYLPGRIFQNGVTVTLVGLPNVGKSHLLNRLLKKERAIVSEMPGTTRDFIEERTLIAGIPLRLVDTAGLRNTVDPVEKIGINLTKRKMEESDIIIFVFDASRDIDTEEMEAAEIIPPKKRIIVINKQDIADKNIIEFLKKKFEDSVIVSAKTGYGIEELEDTIKERVGHLSGSEKWEVMLTSERQSRLVKESLEALNKAICEMGKNSPAEFTALEIRAALERIGELTGEFYNDELLDEIFSRFCIGK